MGRYDSSAKSLASCACISYDSRCSSRVGPESVHDRAVYWWDWIGVGFDSVCV